MYYYMVLNTLNSIEACSNKEEVQKIINIIAPFTDIIVLITDIIVLITDTILLITDIFVLIMI